MRKNNKLRKVFWLGDSRKCISRFPIEVKRTIGHALYFAQVGDHHPRTKMMKGLGSGVYEIFEDHREGTFRAVYTIKVAEKIYVVHAFQKKSKSGIKTPMEDIDLIKKRLKNIKEISDD